MHVCTYTSFYEVVQRRVVDEPQWPIEAETTNLEQSNQGCQVLQNKGISWSMAIKDRVKEQG